MHLPEELRRMEFHLAQEKQSAEQLGLDLQKVVQKAFFSLSGDDFGRLLKADFIVCCYLRDKRD